jgi:hypothetical protein
MSPLLLYNSVKNHQLPFSLCDEYRDAYYKFLCLKVFINDIDGLLISPSVELDKIWHEHLLYNKNYMGMCLKLGTLIYHYPERSHDLPADINNRRALMVELFDKYFGETDIIHDKINIHINIINNSDIFTSNDIKVILNNTKLIINTNTKNRVESISNFIKNKFYIDNFKILYEGIELDVDKELSELDLIFNSNITVIFENTINKLPIIKQNKNTECESETDDIVNHNDLYENPLQIFVNTLSGKTITLEVYESYTILDIKRLIKKKENIPKTYQKLTYRCKLLDSKKTVKESRIENLSTINLMVNLRGC